MNTSFLPSLPLQLSYPLLFGCVIVGFVIGPLSSAAGMGPLIDEARIFVDLALGLVLFELGRRMDLKWMKRDWTLAADPLLERCTEPIAPIAPIARDLGTAGALQAERWAAFPGT